MSCACCWAMMISKICKLSRRRLMHCGSSTHVWTHLPLLWS
jgi:hypothetical protein